MILGYKSDDASFLEEFWFSGRSRHMKVQKSGVFYTKSALSMISGQSVEVSNTAQHKKLNVSEISGSQDFPGHSFKACPDNPG